MKVKECSCYRNVMKSFLDKRMHTLEMEIQDEVKKVLGLNFLGMTTQIFTDQRIRDIFKDKSGRFISSFILLHKPITRFDGKRYILHVEGCPKIDEVPIETEIDDNKEKSDDGAINIPID